MSRLVIAVGLMLLVGMVWSLRQPVPGIASGDMVPVPRGELWNLNP